MSDVTIEGLRDVLRDNPRGVLVYVDELAGWFGSFDAYRAKSGKDRPLWLELYQGGPKTVDRAAGRTVRVPNWSASIVGSIQPGPLGRLMGKVNDDGLPQRFIVIFPQPVAPEVDRPENIDALNRYDEMIRNIWGGLQAADQPFTFSASSRQIRVKLAERARLMAELPVTPRPMRAHLAKWGGLFARLALVFQLVDEAAAGAAQLRREIEADQAGKVRRLMEGYLLQHAGKFYRSLGSPPGEAHAAWIADHILWRELKKITIRDIGRVYRDLRGKRDEARDAMSVLEMYSWVEPLGDQRNPKSWAVNPLVHLRFSERTKRVRQRRAQAMELIRVAAAERRAEKEAELGSAAGRRETSTVSNEAS